MIISAETSGDYKGALTTDTISALGLSGVNVDSVPDVLGI